MSFSFNPLSFLTRRAPPNSQETERTSLNPKPSSTVQNRIKEWQANADNAHSPESGQHWKEKIEDLNNFNTFWREPENRAVANLQIALYSWANTDGKHDRKIEDLELRKAQFEDLEANQHLKPKEDEGLELPGDGLDEKVESTQ